MSDSESDSSDDESDKEEQKVVAPPPKPLELSYTFEEPDLTPEEIEVFGEEPLVESTEEQPVDINNVVYLPGTTPIDPSERLFTQIDLAIKAAKSTFEYAVYLPGRHSKDKKYYLPFSIHYDLVEKKLDPYLSAALYFPAKTPMLTIIHMLPAQVSAERLRLFTGWRASNVKSHYSVKVYKHLDQFEESQVYFLVMQLTLTMDVVSNIYSVWLAKDGMTFGSIANSRQYDDHLQFLKNQSDLLLYHALLALGQPIPSNISDFCAVFDDDNKIPKIQPSTASFSNTVSRTAYYHDCTSMDRWYMSKDSDFIYLPLFMEGRLYLMQASKEDAASLRDQPALPYYLTEADTEFVCSSRMGRRVIPNEHALSDLIKSRVHILPLSLVA